MTPYSYPGILITPEYVFRKTAEVMKVPAADIGTGTRRRDVTDCRHTIAFFLVKGLRTTTYAAGSMVGRDHSTISTSCRKVRRRYEVDKAYREMIHALARMFTVNLEEIEGLKVLKVRKFIDGDYFCSSCHQYSEDKHYCTKCKKAMG